jgi:aspartate racemase
VKTIGLLGGMSWESSALYYRLLNEAVRARLGGLHSARCVLLSVDFAEIERLQVAGDWETAAQVLAADARSVQAAGAEFLVLCTNTMHKVADALSDALDVPLLHIGDVTAAAVLAAGLQRVGLLGTAYTMEQPFLVDRLAAHGLEVLVPEPDDRAEVHRVIYQELCLGVVREESREAYRGVVDRLVARGAEGVVLGCTEIELLIGAGDVAVPVFPTTSLHVEAAVTAALTIDR